MSTIPTLNLINNDPFPIRASALQIRLTAPLANQLGLTTLPLHIHELLFAAGLYTLLYTHISPWLSHRLFRRHYDAFPPRTKLNWDVHVVALVQACLINTAALWTLWADQERHAGFSTSVDRVWGYTGAGGLIQAFASGYFLWDLVMCTLHVRIFGLGLLAHAVAALTVFSFGFRPFVNFYAPIFILYELSSPFLNIHWCLDKLDMTGSKLQWYNGIILLASFFGCRLLWGTYQSVRVFIDIWAAMQYEHGMSTARKILGGRIPDTSLLMYAGAYSLPGWLAITYLASNLVLNALNFYWFGRMIDTVMKRFKEPRRSRKDSIKGRVKEEEISAEGVLVEGLVDSETLGEAVVDGMPEELMVFPGQEVKSEGAESANGSVAVAKTSSIETEGRELRKRG